MVDQKYIDEMTGDDPVIALEVAGGNIGDTAKSGTVIDMGSAILTGADLIMERAGELRDSSTHMIGEEWDMADGEIEDALQRSSITRSRTRDILKAYRGVTKHLKRNNYSKAQRSARSLKETIKSHIPEAKNLLLETGRVRCVEAAFIKGIERELNEIVSGESVEDTLSWGAEDQLFACVILSK